ncbi:hypothetical protein [Polaribacter sp. L3A8]|uniref:hypothetical protein n=1 Tax=Polaribacter sp. L3A8 TaxID=2686361 RepID=UPI00131C4E54|nr:hypothetical protein [Polaribacter sp. L3A8]
MKKVLFIISLALLGLRSISAQEMGGFSGFAGATYPLSSESYVGINVGFEYLFTDVIAAAPSLSYYFIEGVTSAILNIDGRYYFRGYKKLIYFGLAGISLSSYKIHDGLTLNDTGISIGGGLIYGVSENLGLIAQLKYGSVNSGALEPMVGVNFNF